MPRSALIVVDMINSYEHPDGDELARSAERALPQMVRLVERAAEQDVLTIYVNDNFGAWTSNRDQHVEQALDSRHAALVEPLRPRADTAFVVKARHPIFFETPLEYLPSQEDVERIVLVGQATEQCILYSALDGYIRHFDVAVPSDATAHIHEDLARCALRMIQLNMRAEVATTEEVGLS